MASVRLSSPWVTFYKELDALFKGDPEVRVIYYEDEGEVKIYVQDAEKAYALTELLPYEKTFGNVTLKITVVPANGVSASAKNLFEAAFYGNLALSYTTTITGIFTNDLTYVVFKNGVVQYFNDDLSDVNGLCSTLYQDIAKRVFGVKEGIFFCTDVPGNNGVGSFGKPLGEWP